MNDNTTTYKRGKYPRTAYHSQISRENALKLYKENKGIFSGFSNKEWWASLDEEVKKQINKSRSEKLKGENSKFWKGGKNGVCSICGGKTARKHSKKCSSCYHKSRIVNVDDKGNRTYRSKSKCVECGKGLSDTYRNLCRSCSHKGERSYQWKGGITPEKTKIRASIEYKLWRDAVLSRDNFTCQKTGKRGGNMEVHHIKNFSEFPELRFAIDNGITLCKQAHKKFHTIYGKTNNNEQQLLQFLTNFNDV